MENNTSTQTDGLSAAKVEIEAILEKYKANLLPIVLHQGDATFSRIDLVPVREEAPQAPQAPQA